MVISIACSLRFLYEKCMYIYTFIWLIEKHEWILLNDFAVLTGVTYVTGDWLYKVQFYTYISGSLKLPKAKSLACAGYLDTLTWCNFNEPVILDLFLYLVILLVYFRKVLAVHVLESNLREVQSHKTLASTFLCFPKLLITKILHTVFT